MKEKSDKNEQEESVKFFKKLEETGFLPNAVAMLDGLCNDGLFQEALNFLGLMRKKVTIPGIVLYTAVVEGYTLAHKADDAKRIFRKMQSSGISPNAFSYTVLIQGLYECSRLQDAFEFCVEMLEAGHSPNVTTFVGLVEGLCKEKGVEEAKGAIRTLIEKGFAVNEKAVMQFLNKKAPFSPSVWEAIFVKKAP
ncbi:pentatricopeptide repeat-containing protein At4g38150-like [Gastrolobium bilobum]|uniref:pentatricopeptide repeat-containing protein At4g38150-like n=1 Tax=Gastrolobium bilobum TaxID=150636 RepID=UPI002AB25E63|nr:pentatricopeptide repeat-containing protein At4g38150-like [Gastrolobium bilobum]